MYPIIVTPKLNFKDAGDAMETLHVSQKTYSSSST